MPGEDEAKALLPRYRNAEEGKGQHDDSRRERKDQGYASGIAHQRERVKEDGLQTALHLRPPPSTVVTAVPAHRQEAF